MLKAGRLVQSRTSLPALRLPQAERLRQFVKFCLVGGSGVIVDMTLLHWLARWCGWNVSLSKVCSAEAAMLNNFLWNEVWTFRGAVGGRIKPGLASDRDQGCAGASPYPAYGRAGVARRLGRFHWICGAGIGLAVCFLHLFYRWLGCNLYAANFLAIVLVTLWNFWLNARFNWQSGRRTPQ